MLLFNIVGQDSGFVASFLCITAYITTLLLAMTFHEFGHAYAAVREGDITPKVARRYTLAPLSHVDLKGVFFLLLFGFGWARPVPVDPRNFKRGKKSALRVFSAGIVNNLILAVVSAVIYTIILTFFPSVFTSSIYGSAVKLFLRLMVDINMIFAFFNLLPFNTFDGFRIIETFTGAYNGFVLFMKRYSFMLLLVTMFTGLISAYITLVPVGLADLLIDGLIKLFSIF